MATVRISNALVSDVVTLARSKMRPAVDKAIQQRPDDAWGQRIYDTLFGDMKPILDQLPSYWKNNTSIIEINAFGEVSRSHSFPIAGQPWPMGPFSTPLAKRAAPVQVRYQGTCLELRQNPAWEELFAVMGEYFGRIDAARTREGEFVDMVKKVLDSHSTLAPALKVWPPLWDLIPDAMKDRHREITIRTKSDKVDVGVDLGKLTAMATAVKFGL